jgi:hypothetical protein
MNGANKRAWLSLVLLALGATAAAAQGALVTKTPDLSSPDARRMYDSRFREVCRRKSFVDERRVATGAPAGSFVCQTPQAGDTLNCSTEVTVYVASGEARNGYAPCEPQPADQPPDQTAPATPAPEPTLPPSPPVERSWEMPDLTAPGGVERLARQTQRFCHRAPAPFGGSVAESDAPQGTILTQTPSAGSPITCATPISVTRSSGCGPDTRSFPERLFGRDACHGPLLPFGPWPWFVALGVVGVGGLALMLRPQPQIPKGKTPPAPPQARVEPGSLVVSSRPDPEGLRRGAPDVVIESAGAAITTTPGTLQIREVKDV